MRDEGVKYQELKHFWETPRPFLELLNCFPNDDSFMYIWFRFLSGKPIPRRLQPTQDAVEFYTNAENRGYLSDPGDKWISFLYCLILILSRGQWGIFKTILTSFSYIVGSLYFRALS